VIPKQSHPLPLLHDATPSGEERVLERIGGLDPLVRVQRQALLQQVDKVVEVPRLRVVHARRRRHKTRAEVARRLYHGEGLDCCLLYLSVRESIIKGKAQMGT
jgi:hypothetical protein